MRHVKPNIILITCLNRVHVHVRAIEARFRLPRWLD